MKHHRLAKGIDLFDSDLIREDMNLIDAPDKGERASIDSETFSVDINGAYIGCV